MERIIVVGGGQAGASLVANLRTEGYSGVITLFCDEPVIPYQRPPLSKAYLLGEMSRERLYLRPESFYAEQSIDLRLGQTVTHIDREARTVSAGGETLGYDALALTTGSLPRRLPDAIGGGLEGVHVVRTLADIDRMEPSIAPGKRALIVGGGYIGLEAAAVASKKGLQVTLIEMAPRILQRVAAPETSDFFRALHEGEGVDIREDTGLERLVGENRVERAILAGGEEIAADIVIAGIGIAPDTSLAEAAGLDIQNGIAVNEYGQTSDPAIWAAGDCASFPRQGQRIRLESVQNAIDQAENAACNILGAQEPYVPSIWFWSDQYDTKLQIAGLNTGYETVITRPGERDGAQSLWYFAGDTLLAVDAMNDSRAYMIGKRLIEMGKSPAPDVIANQETNLKSLLRS